MAFHTRSISLPTRSHFFVLKAEEELSKLRACVASPSLKVEVMLDALKAVRHVYEYINDLLYMSSNQNSLSHPQQSRLVDQELEESIKLLDICSTSKDNLGVIKAHIKDLELAMRRGDLETLKSKLRYYSLLVKKANKDVKMQINKSNESIESIAVATLLSETAEITISLLQSIFSFLSKQLVGQKSCKWSLVLRLTKKKIEDKEHPEDDALDVTSLVNNVEELENGLESLFRQLIQCRVSLLNLACNAF